VSETELLGLLLGLVALLMAVISVVLVLCTHRSSVREIAVPLRSETW
jgi:hypothetical protein